VLVGHCCDVLVFSVFCMIGTFSGVVLCIVGLPTSSLYHCGVSTLLFTVQVFRLNYVVTSDHHLCLRVLVHHVCLCFVSLALDIHRVLYVGFVCVVSFHHTERHHANKTYIKNTVDI